VRKYLGVLAGVAALCALSWAQAPAQAPPPEPTPAQTPGQAPTTEATPIPTPAPGRNTAAAPQYPRFEFFAGGSYAEAGLFNAGHWAGLPGWDASLGANATSWLGVVVDGGEYFGTSKIPVSAPAPFPVPPCQPNCVLGSSFNVATREYNFLFGLQLARRKYGMWTPIGELLYGHQGTRGVATPLTGPPVSEVGSGRALVAGGGLDRRINDRLALRIKADYLQTGSFKQKQDNFRVSVGIVIRNAHKKRRTLEDEGQVEP
jgi:hypothetical protein